METLKKERREESISSEIQRLIQQILEKRVLEEKIILKVLIMREDCQEDGNPCDSYGSCGQSKNLIISYAPLPLEEEREKIDNKKPFVVYYLVNEWDFHDYHGNNNYDRCKRDSVERHDIKSILKVIEENLFFSEEVEARMKKDIISCLKI